MNWCKHHTTFLIQWKKKIRFQRFSFLCPVQRISNLHIKFSVSNFFGDIVITRIRFWIGIHTTDPNKKCVCPVWFESNFKYSYHTVLEISQTYGPVDKNSFYIILRHWNVEKPIVDIWPFHYFPYYKINNIEKCQKFVFDVHRNVEIYLGIIWKWKMNQRKEFLQCSEMNLKNF